MMEIRKFDEWLGHRENVIDEGLLDRILGRSAPAAPAHSGPEEPSQVYTNPTVSKYTQEVLAHLGLTGGAPIEVIDDSNRKVGDYGTPPKEFRDALMRFIAGHVLGGSRSFLNVSYHDGAIILNYLDHLRYVGERHSIAERLDLTNPQSLSSWIQSHVPVAHDAVTQTGFNAASQGFQLPRKKAAPSLMKDAKARKLIEAAALLVNQIHVRYTGPVKNKTITPDIRNAAIQVADALKGLGVLAPTFEPAAPPEEAGGGSGGKSPDFAGHGRKSPKK